MLQRARNAVEGGAEAEAWSSRVVKPKQSALYQSLLYFKHQASRIYVHLLDYIEVKDFL